MKIVQIENAPLVREKICAGMEPLGIQVEPGRNEQRSSEERRVSTDASGVAILVIPTDEEGVIAADTYQLATQKQNA